MTTPLDDIGINDQLVKLRPLLDQTCFDFIDLTKIFWSGKQQNSREYLSLLN